MKLYKRKDFIKLPPMTIYSKTPSHFDLMEGLFCKTSTISNDFTTQDLISEAGYPNEINDGMEALIYQTELRDGFKDFRTDLDCSGRDGMFDEDDTFIVWDKEDLTKLRNYLDNVIQLNK